MPRSRRKPVAEINVVPYIDVMLVLLVIFMITAPLLTQGVNVNLPQAQAKSLSDQDKKPLIVSIDQSGQYYLNTNKDPSQPITAQALMSEVSSLITHAQAEHIEQPVYVKGDRYVNYGKVVEVMALLQKAGAEDVGLITEEPSNKNGP